MINELDLAWAAGFFDGEGYITISRRNFNGYTGHFLRVGINHVAPEPLEKIRDMFGGSFTKTTKVSGNRKPRHQWLVNTKRAKEVLEILLPYLVNKVREAEVAIEFQSTINPGNSGKLSPETTVYREGMKVKLMELNANC